MAKDKQIQELEIKVSVRDDLKAERKIERLRKKADRLTDGQSRADRKFLKGEDKRSSITIKNRNKEVSNGRAAWKRTKADLIKSERETTRIRKFATNERVKLNMLAMQKMDKLERVSNVRRNNSRKGDIRFSKRRFKITPETSVFNTMRGDPRSKAAIQQRVLDNLGRSESARASTRKGYMSRKAGGVASLEQYRNKVLGNKAITDRVLGNLSISALGRDGGINKLNRPVTGQNSAMASMQLMETEVLKQKIKSRLGGGTGGFSSIDTARDRIMNRQRIEGNIAASRALRGSAGVENLNRPVTMQNSALVGKFENTILGRHTKKRIEIEKRLASVTNRTNKVIEKSIKNTQSQQGAGRRSGGGLVGAAMLYMGAATMGSYMAGSAIGGALALGDVTATVESDVLKGQAFRERYAEKNDVGEFDNAVDLYSRLSGQSNYLAQSQMAQIAGSLEAAGVNLKGDQLTGIARATRGLSGGMGITEDMASQKILGLLSGRMSATDAGLVGVKRSSDPAKTLDNILKFMEKNAVTAAVMKEGTMSSIMARIRTAPMGLIATLLKDTPEQMKEGTRVFAQWVEGFFGKGDKEVVEAWRRTMKEFEETSKSVFDEDPATQSKVTAAMSAGVVKLLGATVKAILHPIDTTVETVLGVTGIGNMLKFTTGLFDSIGEHLGGIDSTEIKPSSYLTGDYSGQPSNGFNQSGYGQTYNYITIENATVDGEGNLTDEIYNQAEVTR